MGGIGSGNHYRWNKHTTFEDTKRIDIRWLKRKNLLREGYSGSMYWTSDGEKTGEIMFTVFSSSIQLRYHHRQAGEEWQQIRENVPIEFTPCHMGGERPWFQCPGCGLRVAILCSNGPYFLCRKCYGLKYDSQMESDWDRALRARRKLGNKTFDR